MTIGQHVPSLERCIELDKLGYVQGESLFVWARPCGEVSISWQLISRREVSFLVDLEFKPLDMCELIDAPLVTELLERMPKHLRSPVGGSLIIDIDADLVHYDLDESPNYFTDHINSGSLPNAVADLYIWLCERSCESEGK